MKLIEFGGDIITTTVRNAILERSNIMQYAEFYQIAGNAANTRKHSAATGGKFRTVNNDYAANVVDPAFATPTLKIYGDKVQTDWANERRGSDIASVRAADLIAFSRRLGQQLQAYYVNGAVATNANQFNGFKAICPAGQLITPAAAGISFPVGNSDANRSAQQVVIEQLSALIGSIDGGAQFLLANAAFIARLTSTANITTIMDDFGKPVASFNGVPILDAGYDASGSLIIPSNEVVGASGAVCTSVYAARFGEATDLSCATNVGVAVKDLGLVGVQYTYAVDFDLDLALLNDRAIGRLQGIKLS